MLPAAKEGIGGEYKKMMESPCYRCHLRSARCHAECAAYAEWRREREESRLPSVDITTEACEKKAKNALRRMVKDRADGRGKHKGE